MMDSIFFDTLKTACQKANNHLRAQIPRPPIKIMAEQSEESPVCHSLIIINVGLKKPLRYDVSQIHTLLFGLTDKQYKEERLNGFARVVKFFTVNKFPNLKSLVLNNVNLNDELLECFQEYNFEYFHLWYFSLCDNTDEKSNSKKYLKKFKTLSIKEFRIDTSPRLMFPNIEVDIPPKMEKLTLKIDSKGSSPDDDSNTRRILFNAKESKDLSIVQFSCDPSFPGKISVCLPIMRSIKKFICHVMRNQIMFFTKRNSIWGDGVEKLCMHDDLIQDTCTTFPNCYLPTSNGDVQKRTARCKCGSLELL